MTEALFSFGTLRDPAVQRALFGRAVPSVPDRLPGFRVGMLTITDPEVVRLSGTDRHPALQGTGDPADLVDGVVLEVAPDELAAADEYERVSYRRIAAVLESGRRAWIYVPRASD